MRKDRPVALNSEELRFDLGRWLAGAATVVDAAGVEWTCECPRCGRDKLAVNVATKAWQCWMPDCEFKGWRPRYLVGVVLGISPSDADDVVLAFGAGVDLGPVEPLANAPPRTAAAIPVAPCPQGETWGDLGRVAPYAWHRGIPPAHAEAFGLCTVVPAGTTRANWLTAGRLMFPVWGPSGRLVFWTARAVDESPLKLVNLPFACKDPAHPPTCACKHEKWGLAPTPDVAGKEEVLAGLHLLRPGAPAYLVEGPVDAAVCGPGFVATLGASCSAAQAALLAAAGVSEVVIAYDGDKAGRHGAASAFSRLSQVVPTRVAALPEGKDPGELGRAAVLALAAAAPPFGGVAGLGGDLPDARVDRPRMPFVEQLRGS